MVMLFRPDLVRADRVRKPVVASCRLSVEGASPRTFNYFDEITDVGGLGDPTRAKVERARVIAEKTTELVVRALKEILAVESRLHPGRAPRT